VFHSYWVSLTGPVAAPSDLSVSDIESTTLTVHWEPVARADIMGEIKEYKVWLLHCTSLYSKMIWAADGAVFGFSGLLLEREQSTALAHCEQED